MAEWEARMLAMIAMPAGAAHVLGPVDLSVEARFDLTGKLLAHSLDTPRGPAAQLGSSPGGAPTSGSTRSRTSSCRTARARRRR